MDARPSQVKIPADAVRYNAGDATPSNSCAFGIIRVHSNHLGVIFHHGGREDGCARASEALHWNASCKKAKDQLNTRGLG